jgi:hypothetical protein
MKVFYIAFDYGQGQVGLIDGPYGTLDESQAEMVSIDASTSVDNRLVIVEQTLEVMNVYRATDRD